MSNVVKLSTSRIQILLYGETMLIVFHSPEGYLLCRELRYDDSTRVTLLVLYLGFRVFKALDFFHSTIRLPLYILFVKNAIFGIKACSIIKLKSRRHVFFILE